MGYQLWFQNNSALPLTHGPHGLWVHSKFRCHTFTRLCVPAVDWYRTVHTSSTHYWARARRWTTLGEVKCLLIIMHILNIQMPEKPRRERQSMSQFLQKYSSNVKCVLSHTSVFFSSSFPPHFSYSIKQQHGCTLAEKHICPHTSARQSPFAFWTQSCLLSPSSELSPRTCFITTLWSKTPHFKQITSKHWHKSTLQLSLQPAVACYLCSTFVYKMSYRDLKLLPTYWKTPRRRSQASWRSQSPQWTVPGSSPCMGYQRTRMRMKSGGNYAPIDRQRSWSHSWMAESAG